MAADNEAVLYQEVKAWIAQQEAFEAEHNRPAPLTSAQRKALEALRLPSSVGDVNYVGMLQEYRQRHPGLGEIVYTEEASGVLAGGTTGRVCRVAVPEAVADEACPVASFPAAGGYGLDEATGRPPAFPTKKAAKHFAARCALDWLVDRGRVPPYAATTTTAAAAAAAAPKRPLPPPAPVSPAAAAGDPPASPPHKRQSVARPPAPAPAPAPPAAAAAAATDDDDGPATTTTTTTTKDDAPVPAAPSRRATELVVGLCRDLNIPAPRYQFEATGAGANTFDGSADFDDYGDDDVVALRDGSAVRDVAGREAARQAIAEKLVVLLRKIDAERDAQVRLATGEVDGDGNGAAL